MKKFILLFAIIMLMLNISVSASDINNLWVEVVKSTVKDVITEDSVSNITYDGNVLINKANMHLQNVNIKGDLFISKASSASTIRFINVKVDGLVFVQGSTTILSDLQTSFGDLVVLQEARVNGTRLSRTENVQTILGKAKGVVESTSTNIEENAIGYIIEETEEIKEVEVIAEIEVAPSNGQVFQGSYEIESSVNVPILLYHHFSDKIEDGTTTVTAEVFESHIMALVEDGFTTISFEELIAYVEYGIKLPEKPIIITMDDGYFSNYDVAFPILKKYDAKATIFIIGVAVGKDTYKDTEFSIIPRFSYEQAQDLVNSGLISIQSHSYDMHQRILYEEQFAREGVVPFEWETEEEFIEAIRKDYELSKAGIESYIGIASVVYSYPFGKSSDLANIVLSSMGIKATVTTEPKTNVVENGIKQSLQSLSRFNISNNMTAEDILALVN